MRTQQNSGRLPTRHYYRMISFKAEQDLDERLIEAAAKQNLSISDLIRKCCVAALAAGEAPEN